MKAFYSINFGKHDSIKNHQKTDGWDYILFSDRDVKDSCYDKVIVIKEDLKFNLLARKVFINSTKYLPEYEQTFFVGGQIECKYDLNDFIIKHCKDVDFNIMHHPRGCVYKEAIELKKWCGDKGKQVIDNQMARYRKLGMPTDFGLFATGIMIRRNTLSICKLEDKWWDETINPDNCPRDQLGLPFAMWNNPVSLNTFGNYWDVLRNEFHIYQHKVVNPKKL